MIITKTRRGILRPEKARDNCTRNLHRIVLVKCTRVAVHCYSSHYHGFYAGNLYFSMNLLIDQVIVDLIMQYFVRPSGEFMSVVM